MQGVAPFISTVMRRKFGIDSLDLGTKSTGLTYPSFFDWPAHVDDAFSKEHFAALIVFLPRSGPWPPSGNGKPTLTKVGSAAALGCGPAQRASCSRTVSVDSTVVAIDRDASRFAATPWFT